MRPADSVDTDSGPPTAATLGLTIILAGEEVAATGTTSLPTSLHSMKSDGKVNQPSTKETDIRRKKPTINDQLTSAKSDDRKPTRQFTYLSSASICGLPSNNVNN